MIYYSNHIEALQKVIPPSPYRNLRFDHVAEWYRVKNPDTETFAVFYIVFDFIQISVNSLICLWLTYKSRYNGRGEKNLDMAAEMPSG